MHRRTFNRLLLTLGTGLLIISGIFIILYNLNRNIIFFYPPSELSSEIINNTRPIRIGGIVQDGSIEKIGAGEIKFKIADSKAVIEVYFKGITPALFREKQGIVAKGYFNQKLFIAEELLTKHDERYYP